MNLLDTWEGSINKRRSIEIWNRFHKEYCFQFLNSMDERKKAVKEAQLVETKN